MKKIVATVAIKNEADIVESFCRYTLSFCDIMLVYENHKSSDNTREILTKLIYEGLSIYFEDDEDKNYEIAKKELIKIAANKYNADLVIPLDTDEFLYHIDGINPRETLEKMQEDVEYQAIWRTYVYEHEPDIKLGFMPNNFTHYRNPEMENPDKYERHKKVIISKYLIVDKKATVVDGTHFLIYPNKKQSIKSEICDKLVFAHFPIRSKKQVERKGIVNWINKWHSSEPYPRDALDAFQLGRLFNEIKATGEVSTTKMKKYSIEYAMLLDANISGERILTSEKELEDIIISLGDKLLIYGPLDVSFCADRLNLRYTNYNDDDKVLMRALLEKVDETVTYLAENKTGKRVAVSVIIPVYNTEKYLRECLDSIVNQTLHDIEIICINDGSTDDSLVILNEYAANDNRFVVISQENRGQGAARNKGIRAAKGKYIYFIDSDDMLKPNALEKTYNYSVENNLDIVSFDSEIIYDKELQYENNRRISDNYYIRAFDYSAVDNGPNMFTAMMVNDEYRCSPCMLLISTDYIKKCHISFCEGVFHEDDLFTFLCIMQADRVSHLKETFYIRRIRSGSTTTGEGNIQKLRGYLIAYRDINTFVENREYSAGTKHQIDKNLENIKTSMIILYSNTEGSDKWLGELSKDERGLALELLSINLGEKPYISNAEPTNKKQGIQSFVNIKMVFAVMLLLAILINIIQFRSIDNIIWERYRALYNYDTSDIYEIVFSESPGHKFYYGMAEALGTVSNNAVLIIPDDYYLSYLMPEVILFFGNISSIERLNYDVSILPDDLDIRLYTVIGNEDIPQDRQYRILMSAEHDKAKEFLLIEQYDEVTLIIDITLLTKDVIRELRR
ncbi:MAG: glycosyltransferase [Oscillospiraceae bacterium]|jgi:glycosyltransferase involved in cell wall biosynthesis|nr:glycosyltransferase [Oscillospiraceae bacterium]